MPAVRVRNDEMNHNFLGRVDAVGQELNDPNFGLQERMMLCCFPQSVS